jgi:UDP:flavonoid glycosyltransferase YjiC (YdhE family)
MDFGASIAAESRSIPVATVQATAWRPEMRRLAIEPLNAIRIRHGLPDDLELRQLHGAIFFTTRPPSLRDPAAPMPASTTELRPVADDRRPDDPDDDPFPPRDGRPRVAVTLGTVNASQAEVLRHIVDGAVAAGADVVVALGADPTTFGPTPPPVTLRAYVPMSRLLPASDVVAFHGGSGTMLAAAAAGVPMVIVPLGADQPDNADRTEAAGIARAVALEGLSADAVRTALEAVLGDPDYRSRAAAVAAEVAAMPSPEAAVTHHESLVG